MNKDDNIHKSKAYNIGLCCPRIQYSKNQINWIFISYKSLLLKKLKINIFKMDIRTFWYNEYRVATISKSYLVTLQSLKSIGQWKKALHSRRMEIRSDRQTLIIEKLRYKKNIYSQIYFYIYCMKINADHLFSVYD